MCPYTRVIVETHGRASLRNNGGIPGNQQHQNDGTRCRMGQGNCGCWGKPLWRQIVSVKTRETCDKTKNVCFCAIFIVKFVIFAG